MRTQPLIDHLAKHGYPNATYLGEGAEGITLTIPIRHQPPHSGNLVAKFWKDLNGWGSFDVWTNAKPKLLEALPNIIFRETINLEQPYIDTDPLGQNTDTYHQMGLTIVEQIEVLDTWPKGHEYQLPDEYHNLYLAILLCQRQLYEAALRQTTPGTQHIITALQLICETTNIQAQDLLPGIGKTKNGKIVIYDII